MPDPLGLCQRQPCDGEPFLHALTSEEEHFFCCTRHTKMLRYMRVLDFNGRLQVHEVEPACFDPASIWDIEDNCCVADEDAPLELQEIEEMTGAR